jgi:hypothetical protein
MLSSQFCGFRNITRIILSVLFFFAGFSGLNAQGFNMPQAGESGRGETRLFPGAYFIEYLEALRIREAARPYWVFTEAELANFRHRYIESESILLNNDILAYYGHPLSVNMGILGRYSKEELNEQLEVLAEEFRAISGGRGVVKAFYLIYGTVWPAGEIGIIRESVLKEYIDFALENDILIFIDHQIGRYNPIDSLKRMLPYLKYPHVHLALDPEWRTTKPMLEIGTVSAEEINQAQKVMEEYMIENNIPGERLLVIHQFNHRMIGSRPDVKSNFQKIRLVLCADGFGSPPMKRSSYAFNARATNIPIKGFKLFYEGMPGAGFDYPLMSPKDVYDLNPRPYVIMYQ